MARLTWDEIEKRRYENGLDRGVLYLPSGNAVPWNGLVSVVDKNNSEPAPVYFDGVKINDFASPGEFEAVMTAITYPDEFMQFDGGAQLRPGVYVTNQKPKVFSLCYRTLIGNADAGTFMGYKLHLAYNLVATPADKTYKSISTDPEIVNFQWDIRGVSQSFPGVSPTSHFIIDSRTIDPWLLDSLQTILYGDEDTDPYLPTLEELFEYIDNWNRFSVVDHGDGTWTASSDYDGYIEMLDDDLFQITSESITIIDEDTYIISDVYDNSEVIDLFG